MDASAISEFKKRFPDLATLISAEPAVVAAELVIVMQSYERANAWFHAGNFIGTVGNWYGEPSVIPDLNLTLSEGYAWAQHAMLMVDDPTQGTNGILRLTRRGREFTRDQIEVAQLRTILPLYMLHDDVRTAALPIFDAGKYEAAVFEAFKLLEVRIRDRSGAKASAYGKPMIMEAFNVDRGPLRDVTATLPEREALRDLMVGSFGLFKNPRSHRNTDLNDPKEAASLLVLASHLLSEVDFQATVAELV